MSNAFLLLSAIMPHTPVNTSRDEELPTRTFTTPKKLHFGADNSRNGDTSAKSWKRDTTSSNRRQTFNARFEETPKEQLQVSLQSSHSSDSECESEVSVSKLKGWLDDFGKQNKNHCDKVTKIGQVPTNANLQKPTRAKIQVKHTKLPIKRSTEQMKDSRKGPTMTPVRFKSRKNDKVQATDNGYASVKQLSAWLADDPTTSKATRGCVRRGMNVINKSRMFEKDLEDVIIEEVDMHHGEVNDRKQWLQNAFEPSDSGSDFDRRSAVTELVSVQDKKKWLNGAFGDRELLVGGSLIEGCDDRSAISVNNKRDWLQKAFKKGSERLLDGNDTHDSATPAKKKWQDHARRRSSQHLIGSATKAIAEKPAPVNTSTEMSDIQELAPSRQQASRESKPILKTSAAPPIKKSSGAHNESNRQPQPPVGFKAARQLLVQEKADAVEKPVCVSFDTSATRENPSNQDLAPSRQPVSRGNTLTVKTSAASPVKSPSSAPDESNDQNRQSQPKAESPLVGFKAARQLLLQRSAANGNPVKVLTKVQMRKNKFERWQKEGLKGAGPKGLLKPSWAQGAAVQRPSNQYTKTFLPDIAPQKSFEELP